ncbi:hypothetical protein THAOC_33947, partial [Thalassiosira oceanica]
MTTTTAVTLSTPPGGPRGCRPAGRLRRGREEAPHEAAQGAREVEREERWGRPYGKSGRRREVRPAADEAELARTDREREERQAVELAAASSTTVVRGIDDQYLEVLKKTETVPWPSCLEEAGGESAGTDSAPEARTERRRADSGEVNGGAEPPYDIIE